MHLSSAEEQGNEKSSKKDYATIQKQFENDIMPIVEQRIITTPNMTFFDCFAQAVKPVLRNFGKGIIPKLCPVGQGQVLVQDIHNNEREQVLQP